MQRIFVLATRLLLFPSLFFALPAVILMAQEKPAPAVAPVGGQKSPVEAIPFGSVPAAALAGRKEDYSFSVEGADWMDTKVMLAPGDRVSFTATGTVSLADGRSVTPVGVARGWKDMMRAFAANGADVGALVGRIGNQEAVVPFSIGANKELNVAAPGELFLRINSSSDLAATGKYAVTLKIAKGAAQTSAAGPNLAQMVSPTLFQDIPRRVQDKIGNLGDMVNFSLIGSADEITRAFTSAGWVAVDKTDQEAVLHGLVATLEHQAYTGVPMSTLYLFGRSQDLSFERAAPIAVAAVRHHLRIWKTTEMVGGRQLWVGSATHDNGFERDQRNGGITHHVDPQIDQERDFVEQSFAAAGVLDAAVYVTPANAFTASKTATGGAIQSDGRIVMMDLRAGVK